MEAASFDEVNVILDKPPSMSADECDPLGVCRTMWGDMPVVISCFKPTKDELEEINRTGRVWLTVVGVTMAPVILTGHKPECLAAIR